MFNFNLERAKIYQAVKWERYFKFANFGKKLFFILALLAFLAFLIRKDSPFLGLSIIFLTIAIFSWLKIIFFEGKLKKPQILSEKETLEKVILNPERYNLAEFLSFEVAKSVGSSLRFCRKNKIPEVSASLFFYHFLYDNPKLKFLFSRALLDLKEIKEILASQISDWAKKSKLADRIEEIKFSRDFQNSIFEALKTGQKKGHLRVEVGDIIIALASFEPIFKEILFQSNLKAEDIENLVYWQEYLEEKIEKRKRFWEYENLLKRGTLAKEWLAGYTITLDKFSFDWTKEIKKALPEIIGHQKEIEQTERILAKKEINNVLLVGNPGTGRKSIISAVGKKSLLGQSLPEVNYKRIVELDLAGLLAKIISLEEVEILLERIFQEVISAGNVILVIDEFHNYLGGISRLGAIDISGILGRYLHLPEFQIIAITTYAGLHETIERNPSILALFEKVEVSEISLKETLLLLENFALILEKKYKKFISYPALKAIVNLTERYFPDLFFPEKAMELLDEVTIYVSQKTKDFVVLPSQVTKIVTEKTQIPVGEIEAKEKEILLNLEKLIHQRIINQEEAVKGISTAMRRARAEVTIRKGPMGVFLFLGPTGVGKTETSKALSEIYFGSEERMIRLDMSEFQEIKDIARLIGAPGQEGLLTTPVRENPFSLILLDEIEKAHPNILNLFLQVFDEGHLTDGQGRKVIFRETIIISTSNAGAELIWKEIREKKKLEIIKEELLDYLFEKAIFRPEFVNRFDGVIIFQPLSKESLLDIAQLMLEKLKKNLSEKGIEFVITQPLKEKLIELGYSPTFGARELRRVIAEKVENPLAEAILRGKLRRGERVEVTPEDFSLKINP